MLAIVTVFLCGLMVGRTPEYLGKKIGQREIVLVALYVLTTPVAGAGRQRRRPQRATPAWPACRRAARTASPRRCTPSRRPSNNNGSAFAGLTSGTPFWNTLLGLCMLLGRFLPIVLVLALAGPLRRQQTAPAGAGTLPTHRPLFVVLLTGVALVVVGLTYVPVLALGPIVESLS